MSSDALIEARDVSVLFPLYHGSSRSLKKMLVAAASGRLAEDKQHRVVVRALSDISFRLEGGERLGLVGPDGAGKTTLLRVLAGIYEPVTGSVRRADHGLTNNIPGLRRSPGIDFVLRAPPHQPCARGERLAAERQAGHE
jgi:ABC-type multidrug transport system ATPase subunit